jgi:hypothetical protein
VSLYGSLDHLVSATNLPDLANVHVVVEEFPHFGGEGGGKWLMTVASPSRNSRAIVSILVAPEDSGINLSYSATSAELLELFTDDDLRGLFLPGEELLVQAVPRRGIRDGETVLYLNVPAIAILRPSQLLGRRLVDFSSPCSRRTYLTITKAVGRKRGNTGYRSAIVGGHLGHDLVSACAVGELTKKATKAKDLISSISDDTLIQLAWLALASENATELAVACNRGLRSMELAFDSKQIQNVLASDNDWVSESERLNNGVSASPDLLGTRTVVELKQVDTKASNYDSSQIMRQVEGYLAWAMVEFGVDEVCNSWKGVLLNIHEKTGEGERVEYCIPQAQFIGWRILNRHKLLGSLNGHWLPAPDLSECNFCEFSRQLDGQESLATACTYYCQTERSWNCIDNERECPLLGNCDQYDKYEPYERIDTFNQLRQDLREEEEEQEAINGLLNCLSQVGGQSIAFLSGFKIESFQGNRVFAGIPPELKQLTFARKGDRFSAVDAEGQSYGTWTFLKRKEDSLIFDGASLGRRPSGEIALRFEPGGRLPAREQLAWLDIDQRKGDRPLSLRLGASRTSEVVERTWQAMNDIPADASFVVVNSLSKSTEYSAATTLIQKQLSGMSVLVISDHNYYSTATLSLTPDNVRSQLLDSDNELAQTIRELANRYRDTQALRVEHEELINGRINRHVERNGKFDFVVVLDAEEMHLLAISKCINAAKKGVYLFGNAESVGPRTETEAARRSILGQNAVKYLTDIGAAILPEPISFLDMVDLEEESAANGFRDFPNVRCGIRNNIPVEIRIVDESQVVEPQNFVVITGNARNTCEKRREIEFDLSNQQNVPLAQMRQILKRLNSNAIETLSADVENRLDSSVLGYAARVTKRSVFNSNDSHSVKVKIPLSQLRYFQEKHLFSTTEINRMLERRRELSGETCVATSPFLGQCVALAKATSEEGISLPVYAPNTLSTRFSGEQAVLLISMVTDQSHEHFPHPLDDPRSVLPLLVGNWKRIEIFCSTHVASHYPLIQILQKNGESTPR